MVAVMRPQKPRPMAQGLSQSLKTMLPPIRGINSTGAVAAMPPTDALEMDNLISTDAGVTVREGWSEYATHIGLTAFEIRTIMSFDGAPATSLAPPNATSKLFAVTDDGIYNIEGGGNMSSVSAMRNLSGAAGAGQMSHVQFTNDVGQFLIACSETDGAFFYNGTGWAPFSNSGSPGPGVVTGADPSKFVQVCAWKKRLFFVERASSRVWILPVGAIGGTLALFDFGPQLLNGGSVLGLTNWTQDDGNGIDDRLVILGSSGDLVIYAGTDPTVAADFENLGTWYIGQPPVGRRCFTTAGGNVYILTQFGVVPVNQIVQGGLDNLLTSDTDLLTQLRKLQGALNNDFSVLLNTQGWELMSLPSKALLHIARPSINANEHIQYAFQQHNLAWSRFLDVPAKTFARRLNEFYGGTTDGRVLRLLNGNSDGVKLDGTGATEIRARLTPAFSYFDSPATQKKADMIRLNFLSPTAVAWAVTMNVDFAVNASTTSPVAGATVGSFWDQSFWDQAFWSGGEASFAEWRSVEALGYALSPTIYLSTHAPTVLASIEYMLTPGGPL